MSHLSFAPRPGAAPLARMVRAQAGLELRLLLRNGEQLLLTLVIPVGLLVGLATTGVVDVGGGERVDVVLPGVVALAVMSTAFTSLAIATGFERRYGVLKRLGATPLPRAGLLAGKTLAVVAVELVQVLLLGAVAAALGWRLDAVGGLLPALLLVVVATAAFAALALLMAGTLRAEATLAAANLVYLLLLAGGGVVVPLGRYPEAAQPVLGLLPLAALSEGLRTALSSGTPWGPLAVLTAWAVLGVAAASRWFRWE